MRGGRYGLTVATVVVLLLAGSATAGPCRDAERGTYLSNVCWLFEDFSRDAFPSRRVVDADPKNCTVDLNGGEVVHLGRANGNLQIGIDGTAMCWTIYGERGLSVYPNRLPELEKVLGKVVHSWEVRVCGRPMPPSRIRAAMRNLFTRYCPIRGQEF